MNPLYTPASVVVLIAAVAAVVTDIRQFKIYNVLTFPLMGMGLCYQLYTGGWEGFLLGLGGVAAGFGILLFPYLIGAMGAGDVKLIMAFGAWLGPQATLLILSIGLAGTATYSFVLLLWQGRLGDSWVAFKMGWYQLAMMSRRFSAEGDIEFEAVRDVVKYRDRRRRLVPFSVMAVLGLVIALVYGDWLIKFWG